MVRGRRAGGILFMEERIQASSIPPLTFMTCFPGNERTNLTTVMNDPIGNILVHHSEDDEGF